MQFNDGQAIRGISQAAFRTAAEALGCEVAAIKAVAEVESRGDGFLPDNRPKILFERHIFSRETNRRFDGKYPDISNRSTGGYLGGTREYARLERAYELDADAALKSASWGRFQIMGFNYKACGCKSVEEYVEAAKQSEDNQLLHFVGFVKTNHLDDELRRKDWAKFARGYNGPAYAKNKYDVKMRQAYEKYRHMTTTETPDVFRVIDVKSMQEALTYLGFDPGVIDGLWGKNTSQAVRNFQVKYHLSNTGGRELETMTAIQAAYYEREQKAS
jgi:hypothetical protein